MTVISATRSSPDAARRLLGPLGQPATWRAAAYLLVSVPLGMLWVLLLAVGLLVGGVTAVGGVGVVVLLGTLAGARALGQLERHLVNALLAAEIPAPPAAQSDDWRGAVRGLVTDPRTWRSLAWLLLRGLAGVLVLAGAVLAGAVLVALLVVPFVDGYLQWGDGWRSTAGLRSAWTLPVAVAGLLVGGWVLRQVAAAHLRAARLLLGPDATEQAAHLAREAGRLAERTALARDLHDSIGHAVTVMVLQAESARRLLDAEPQAARACLGTIGETGRRAMAELDHVLAVLADDGVPVRPPACLAELPDLVRRATSAGMSLRVEVADLDAAARHPASSVAYRVIQEACTNALRHAEGAPVLVRVDVDGGTLRVEVNNGPGARFSVEPAAEPGRGLSGLEERVRLAGGRMSAGPQAGGGWLVRAELPAPP